MGIFWVLSQSGPKLAFADVADAFLKTRTITCNASVGLGDKATGVLNAAGIFIFEQLASSTPERLQEIVGESELRARFLKTWPDQAKLAVAGDWDALAQYKDKLYAER